MHYSFLILRFFKIKYSKIAVGISRSHRIIFKHSTRFFSLKMISPLSNIFQQDYRSNNSNCVPLDMNLVPVYEELKYTGKGIRVAIIDDGIEYTHDDLKDNYVSIIFKKYVFIIFI